jgi:hypothetical protein
MKNKIAVSKFILSKPYHGKSKFSTNFQTWVQNFFRIPTSMILQNYIKCVLTSIKTNKHEAV